MVLEIVGYIGSALVVISMLMSSIVKLRVINTVGSIISGVYAVLCGALPLALMNACLITINLINLWKLSKKQQEVFDLVKVEGNDGMLKHFLDHYKEDILKYFPELDPERCGACTSYIVTKDAAPVGILLGEQQGDAVDVLIDYSTPMYRDCSVGRYLYGQLPLQGIHTLRFAGAVSEGHEPYLKKMGFKQEGAQWILQL
ncbi:MAG: YgjV family protein [Firmicutes bacterium]|nr:YgjV family protein [Bacillota bacterium]